MVNYIYERLFKKEFSKLMAKQWGQYDINIQIYNINV